MNREVEFRGLNEKNKWIYGSLFIVHIRDIKLIYILPTNTYDLEDGEIVKDDSVGQYTGFR